MIFPSRINSRYVGGINRLFLDAMVPIELRQLECFT